MSKLIKKRRFVFKIVLFVILFGCFFVTAWALIKNLMLVENNFFHTGIIKIYLTEEMSIIDEENFFFEPGMTVSKNYFVENQSTFDIYYKVYFDDVVGDLSDIIIVTIKNGNSVLYEGTISELNRKNVKAVDDLLKINEKVKLSAFFHYPTEAPSYTQKKKVYFSLVVDAVQTKNNPTKTFE